jgi:hypothetical protein
MMKFHPASTGIIVVCLAVLSLVLVYFLLVKGKWETSRRGMQRIDSVPDEYWDALAGARIFFGHQSVGNNIIDGIKEIIEEDSRIKLNITGAIDATTYDNPCFSHAHIGSNMDPLSKIDHFQEIMNSGVGEKVDVAFFKFCFVDITGKSDRTKIFSTYRQTMEKLERQFPSTHFVHFTVPLCTGPEGPISELKSFLKMICGRRGGLENNAARQEFNALVNDRYAGRGNVFDLAFYETLNSEGLRYYFSRRGKRIYVMLPFYTHDGCHLNERGRRMAAEQLLIMLARAAHERD